MRRSIREERRRRIPLLCSRRPPRGSARRSRGRLRPPPGVGHERTRHGEEEQWIEDHVDAAVFEEEIVVFGNQQEAESQAVPRRAPCADFGVVEEQRERNKEVEQLVVERRLWN